MVRHQGDRPGERREYRRVEHPPNESRKVPALKVRGLDVQQFEKVIVLQLEAPSCSQQLANVATCNAVPDTELRMLDCVGALNGRRRVKQRGFDDRPKSTK
jgi:hypothetical protein